MADGASGGGLREGCYVLLVAEGVGGLCACCELFAGGDADLGAGLDVGQGGLVLGARLLAIFLLLGSCGGGRCHGPQGQDGLELLRGIESLHGPLGVGVALVRGGLQYLHLADGLGVVLLGPPVEVAGGGQVAALALGRRRLVELVGDGQVGDVALGLLVAFLGEGNLLLDVGLRPLVAGSGVLGDPRCLVEIVLALEPDQLVGDASLEALLDGDYLGVVGLSLGDAGLFLDGLVLGEHGLPAGVDGPQIFRGLLVAFLAAGNHGLE